MNRFAYVYEDPEYDRQDTDDEDYDEEYVYPEDKQLTDLYYDIEDTGIMYDVEHDLA